MAQCLNDFPIGPLPSYILAIFHILPDYLHFFFKEKDRGRSRDSWSAKESFDGSVVLVIVLECQYVRVLERRVLISVSCFRVRSFVLERKDRWVSDVMVVIMVNDQGGVVVVLAVVLQGKRRSGAHHHQKALQSGSVCVSLCQLC